MDRMIDPLLQIHGLIANTQFSIIGWRLWRWVSHEGVALTNGICTLLRRDVRTCFSSVLSFTWRHKKISKWVRHQMCLCLNLVIPGSYYLRKWMSVVNITYLYQSAQEARTKISTNKQEERIWETPEVQRPILEWLHLPNSHPTWLWLKQMFLFLRMWKVFIYQLPKEAGGQQNSS